jgi:hypothetical protein
MNTGKKDQPYIKKQWFILYNHEHVALLKDIHDCPKLRILPPCCSCITGHQPKAVHHQTDDVSALQDVSRPKPNRNYNFLTWSVKEF